MQQDQPSPPRHQKGPEHSKQDEAQMQEQNDYGGDEVEHEATCTMRFWSVFSEPAFAIAFKVGKRAIDMLDEAVTLEPDDLQIPQAE